MLAVVCPKSDVPVLGGGTIASFLCRGASRVAFYLCSPIGGVPPPGLGKNAIFDCVYL